jgi:hypothetical protein
LTDEIVTNLTYHDPDSKTEIKLQIGPIFRIKSFIHYVHFRSLVMIGNPLPWMISTNSDETLNMFVGLHLCHLCHQLI